MAKNTLENTLGHSDSSFFNRLNEIGKIFAIFYLLREDLPNSSQKVEDLISLLDKEPKESCDLKNLVEKVSRLTPLEIYLLTCLDIDKTKECLLESDLSYNEKILKAIKKLYTVNPDFFSRFKSENDCFVLFGKIFQKSKQELNLIEIPNFYVTDLHYIKINNDGFCESGILSGCGYDEEYKILPLIQRPFCSSIESCVCSYYLYNNSIFLKCHKIKNIILNLKGSIFYILKPNKYALSSKESY